MAQDTIITHWDVNGDIYEIQDAGRGHALGVATLDENGRVPYSQLPESAIEFKGYWDASTNTPYLHDGTGTKGDMYYVDVEGTQDLGSGSTFFAVGDRVLYDGSVWKNISNRPDFQDIFDHVHPIGEIYIQYPQQTDPNTLYNNADVTCTWTLQAQYDGAFFRASGTNADTFITANDVLTPQSQATAKNGLSLNSKADGTGTADTTTTNGAHTHSHNIYCDEANGKGWLYRTGYGNRWLDNNQTGSSGNHTHNIYIQSTDTETRPTNFTIQIWKRTA